MNYRPLGHSGLQVSPLCLGMMSYGSATWAPWVLPKSEARPFIRLALDHGINFFDTADFYSYGASEEALAEAMDGLCRREDLVISTKVGAPMHGGPNARGSSRKHIRASVDASLARLRTDYIDLYMLHVWDGSTPIEETVDALDDLVRAGKILYYGASNFLSWQLAHAQRLALMRGGRGFTAMQLQYNLLCREDERNTLPLCRVEGIGVMVYSPLARGWLTGGDPQAAAPTPRERLRSEQDAKTQALYGAASDHAVRMRLIELARRRDAPPGRLALAWLHTRADVGTVIVGALEPGHLQEAVASLALTLDPQETAWLEDAYVPGPPKSGGLQQVLASQKPATAR